MKIYILFLYLTLVISCRNTENSSDNVTSGSVSNSDSIIGNTDSPDSGSFTRTELTIEGKDIWIRTEPIIGDVIFKLNSGNECKIIEKGEKDQIIDRIDYWYKIDFEGKTGWVFGAQTNIKTGEIVGIKDFGTFLKRFAKDYITVNSDLSPYFPKEIGYIQLFNPGAFCSISTDVINTSRIKSIGTNVYPSFPKGGFCEGFPGIANGFYFEPSKYNQLPQYASFDDSGQLSTKRIEIPNPYTNNEFKKVQIVYNEYHLAYLYFININEDWYLICSDYCDCSA
jgi:hypothetical protein